MPKLDRVVEEGMKGEAPCLILAKYGLHVKDRLP